MAFAFLDQVAAAQPRPRPVFKAFRTGLIMNEDARRAFFPATDRVLLAYDRETGHLALKALPPDVYEHEGWRAFRIEPQAGAPGRYRIRWRHFWDREVGLRGGRPFTSHGENIQRLGDDVVVMGLF